MPRMSAVIGKAMNAFAVPSEQSPKAEGRWQQWLTEVQSGGRGLQVTGHRSGQLGSEVAETFTTEVTPRRSMEQ